MKVILSLPSWLNLLNLRRGQAHLPDCAFSGASLLTEHYSGALLTEHFSGALLRSISPKLCFLQRFPKLSLILVAVFGPMPST